MKPIAAIAAAQNLLQTTIDPHTGADLLQVSKVNSNDAGVSINVVLGYPAKNYAVTLRAELLDKLQSQGTDASITVRSQINTHATQAATKPLANIKNIIAVASGKGGVGKSTTAVNLALALAAEESKVGILDADIYGPSVPLMLGLSGKPDNINGKMQPKTSFGVKTISIGYLIEASQAMIWRGPMVTTAVQQLLNDTAWGEIDYLIIDLPPGTGDIQLTLAQKIPVSGAIVVTTPQDIALADVQRSLSMFDKVNIKVLGVVENMGLHVCSNCGNTEAIFGNGGGGKIARQNQVDLLGTLPLEREICQFADSGKPTVAADPHGKTAQIYRQIASKMAGKLSLLPKYHGDKFADIVVNPPNQHEKIQ